jgi:outer membrane protein OmpA-like peptidoglycan-associated protein
MLFVRSILLVLFFIVLHDDVHAQEKPVVSANDIPDSLSLQLKDTDGDGVTDDIDKCINEKGAVSNSGCPITNEQIVKCNMPIAYSVSFTSGSFDLSIKSIGKLNEILEILKDKPEMHVRLSGHTDGIEDQHMDINLALDRINVVKSYLLKAGINENKIICTTHGATHPVANPAKKSGRAKNRRVEIDLVSPL